jgi:arsenite oxidase small subunit
MRTPTTASVSNRQRTTTGTHFDMRSTSVKRTPVSTTDALGDDSEGLTRRRFCNGLLVTSGLLLVAESATHVEAAMQESLVAYPPLKIKGAETLMQGSSLLFDYPTTSDPAVLTRSRDGEFRAFSRRCSHAGCSLEVDSQSRCLRCPCHKGIFDAELGQVIFGPPQRPLEEIVLVVRAGGQVWAVGKRNPQNWAKTLVQDERGRAR